jgi:hypothetical protein
MSRSVASGANTRRAYVTIRSVNVIEVARKRISRVRHHRTAKNGRWVTKTRSRSWGHHAGMRGHMIRCRAGIAREAEGDGP